MFRWFSNSRGREPTAPRRLNNVIAGSAFSQRVVGYVDDFDSVYDLSKRYLGRTDVIAANDRHTVQFANGHLAGYVGQAAEAIGGGYWYKVFDSAGNLVGLVDNGSEIASPSVQTIGSVNYNEGNGGTGWRRAGAALLLLLRDIGRA